MDKEIEYRFSGIDRLYGGGTLEDLSRKKVMVIGLGGVGSWTVESLARSGLGSFVLVDLDEICLSNSNRQIHTLTENIGRLKGEVLKQRMLSIAPHINIELVPEFYSEKRSDQILNHDPDLIIDAIDRADTKAHLISEARKRRIPIVVSGASGGKRNLFAIKTGDLSETRDDRLLARVRKLLRQKHGFPRGSKHFCVQCVYSEELPVFPGENGEICHQPVEGQSARLDCASGLGAASFLTGSFGFGLAQLAIEQLIKK